MKRALSIAAVLLMSASLAALADERKSGKDEKVVSGKIVRLDMNEKSITVEDESGQSRAVLWTDATRVLGGEMKEGEPVQIGYVEAENKMWATWIRVGE